MICIPRSNSRLGDQPMRDDNVLYRNDHKSGLLDDDYDDESERLNALLDESERLSALIAEELEESQKREQRKEERKRRQSQRADRHRELKETLGSNEAVSRGRELLARHRDQTAEEEHRSLIDSVRKKEVAEFFDLSSFAASKTTVKPTDRKLVRLEDRMERHKAKTAHQKDAYAKFEREMKKREEELANKDAKDSQAKEAFAALKAKKMAQRKARSKSPKRSPRVVPEMKRQLSLPPPKQSP